MDTEGVSGGWERLMVPASFAAAPMSEQPTFKNAYDSSGKVNPSMAIIIVVLISTFFFMGFFSLYIRRCTEEEARVNRRNSSAAQAQAEEGKGLDQALVDSLPTLSYLDLTSNEAGKEYLECVVCLSEFEKEDTLRLLPRCSHVFHVECIGAWLKSHSTCPLCRASLNPTFGEGNDASGRHSEARIGPHRDVVLAIDDRGQSSCPVGRPLGYQLPMVDTGAMISPAIDGMAQESSTETGPNVTRESERESARLALTRNSQSFKNAVREVEVMERLGASAVRTPSSLSSNSLRFVNLPIRRSSSLGASGRYLKDYFKNEVFPLGSQLLGVAGVGSTTPPSHGLRRAGSYSGLEIKRATNNASVWSADLEDKEQLIGVLSPTRGDHWVSIDIDSEAPNISYAQPPIPKPRMCGERQEGVTEITTDRSLGGGDGQHLK